MKRGYMKEDIRYLIILLSRVMGLSTTRHLNIFMVHFIETIKKAKMPLDWASTLNQKKNNRKFYMTSYLVYLLVARAIDYPGLYKRGSI